MSNAIATIQSTGLTTSFDEDDITAILNELGNSAAFLARYLPKGAGTGFYSTFASLLGPLADLHDDLASAMAANHVSFGTAGGNPSLTFGLAGGSSVTLIVGSDILTQIAKSDADFLLAIEYSPSLGALDTLFRGTPFAGLKPSNVAIVASTQALTSAHGVALNSGVSLVASFDISASSDPFFQFVSGMLGVTTASAIVNVDGSQQSLSGEISVDKTIALGDLQISFDDLAFSIAMENSQPVFTASQTLTFADYDPTQQYEPDLVLKSGYQVDTSAVSIFGQLASANSVGWQNPFGIQGAVIRTVALETGFTYGPPPSVDSLGVVVDMKWGDYDYQLAFMADRNSLDRNAFALTLNKSVSLVQVFAQMSSVMLGPLAFALVANAGPLFNLIPLTVMSFDSDGDQALDPLISLAPIDTSIVDTTIAAGFEVNARIDLAGVTGQLSLKASADFTAMDGSLDIEALNIKDLLVISGVEPNSHLVANFHSAPDELSLNGNGKIALFGMTLAQADFSLSSSAVLIKDTLFNFGVVQFDIPLLSINFDTGAAEGTGEFNVLGQTLSESRFKITQNQVHFDANMHFGNLLSFEGSVDWSTAAQQLVGYADVTISGTTLANAELLIKADGSVRISGSASIPSVPYVGEVGVEVTATYDDGVAKVLVKADLGDLGEISLTMGADANIANEISKHVFGGIEQQATWVANAIAGAFMEGAAEFVSAVDQIVDDAASLFNQLGIGKKTPENKTVQGNDNNNGSLSGGTGNDKVLGFGGNDTLEGHQGNDLMDGGAGDDTLHAGDGIDALNGGYGNDFMAGEKDDDILYGGAGNDTMYGDNYPNEPSDFGVGNINGNDELHGGPGNDLLHGGGGNDTVYGDDGNDELDGEGGANTMYGGLGNDVYYVRSATDIVVEKLSNEGIDTVVSSIAYSLDESRNGNVLVRVENLTLAGTAAINGTGNSNDNILIGNAANNTLDGFAGDDTLDGGAGADKLNGGTGNDSYVVDNAGDVVTEAADSGIDTVKSAINYTLGANLENLTLAAGQFFDIPIAPGLPPIRIFVGATSGIGNELNNTLIGNRGDNTLTGGDGGDQLDGGAGADKLLGGLGDDTYVVDNIGDVVTEDSNSGTDVVKSSVSYTLKDYVENLTLTGTADFNATGNALDNTLTGNAGANQLDGRAGADTMTGGDGNDRYIVDHSGDIVIENSTLATEIDTVQSSVSCTLGNNVEYLFLTGLAAINGTGNFLDNTLVGNSADNLLRGDLGNDVLSGGAGDDQMEGGSGNDTYVVDSVLDQVVEVANEGTDIVISSISHTLADWVENLELAVGAINGTGNDLNNTLLGNAAANALTGGAGNDVLDGRAGADRLVGGQGNDHYIVDNVSDEVVEDSVAGSGIDSVESAVDFTLGNNIENLTLTGAAISGTGNALKNKLFGNGLANALSGGDGDDALNGGAGADTLIGGAGNDTLDGGAGADKLIGGAGDDTYIVDNGVLDVVVEGANEGNDTVVSAIEYELGAALENLELVGGGNPDGFGNELNNVLLGNAGINVLMGFAGDDVLNGNAEADLMFGGMGNDRYIVDNVEDHVGEDASADGGIDMVASAVGFVLGAYIENLTLTGTAAINGTGNGLANTLTGNAVANLLNGLGGNDVLDGGAGSDTLTGGAGADVFIQTRGNTGVDTLTDFGVGDTLKFNGFTLSAAQNAGNLLLSVRSVDGVTTLDVSSASAPAELATVRLLGTYVQQSFTVSGGLVALADVMPNQAPSGADKLVSMQEDARCVFVATDFGFSDAADSNPGTLAAVIVATTPLNGVVTLNGTAVAAGQAVTAADIAAGLLAYAPAANASGQGLGSFTFQVQDDGGTANGGVDTDTTPNTLHLDVQAVDDAAVLGSANVSVQETNARLSVGGVLSISDLDSAASFVAQPSTAGQYGVFNIGNNGLWTYQANLTFDHLNPGDSLKDSFRVTSSDGTATHVAVTIVGTAETSTVHLGDAPLRQTGTGGQWAQAWTQTGYNVQHKADHSNAAEAWSKLTFSGVSSQLLSGGDISAGDLGVSGQSAASSTVKQEIDGKEALRIVVPGAADSVTIKLSGLFAHDDGSTMDESGVLRLLDAAGHLVAEQVFVADALDGRKTITLAAAGGFASMELLAGAYDAQDHFVYGGYTPEGGGAAVAVATDALGKAHGSDFLLHSADFTVALMGVPA